MESLLKTGVQGIANKQLPHPREGLEHCPCCIQVVLRLIHFIVNFLFIWQLTKSFFAESPENLSFFCFPKTGLAYRVICLISAILDGSISVVHIFILTCPCFEESLGKIKGKGLFFLPTRANHALAMFNTIWIQRISLSCANPDFGVNIFDFGSKESKLASFMTIAGLISAFFNFLVNSWKTCPGRKALKLFWKIIDILVQLTTLIISMIYWFRVYHINSNPTFWIIFAWLIIRLIQYVFNEFRKCCTGRKKKRDNDKEVPLLDIRRRRGNDRRNDYQRRRGDCRRNDY